MANLNPSPSTRFKKGEVNNPTGKGSTTPSYKTMFKRQVGEKWEDIVAKQVELALSGDCKAAKLITEFLISKPVAKVKVENSGPIEFVVHHVTESGLLPSSTALGSGEDCLQLPEV